MQNTDTPTDQINTTIAMLTDATWAIIDHNLHECNIEIMWADREANK
jgi:hypothetical protein